MFNSWSVQLIVIASVLSCFCSVAASTQMKTLRKKSFYTSVGNITAASFHFSICSYIVGLTIPNPLRPKEMCLLFLQMVPVSLRMLASSNADSSFVCVFFLFVVKIFFFIFFLLVNDGLFKLSLYFLRCI